jgi:hypothetical protein
LGILHQVQKHACTQNGDSRGEQEVVELKPCVRVRLWSKLNTEMGQSTIPAVKCIMIGQETMELLFLWTIIYWHTIVTGEEHLEK